MRLLVTDKLKLKKNAKMDENLNLWKKQARSYQNSCCNNLGDRVYDVVNEEQLSLKVGYALYNAPSEVDEDNKTVVYTTTQQKHIKLICDKIKSLQQPKDEMYYISFLFVVFRVRNKKNDVGVQVLIRIPKFVDNKIDPNSHIFLDPKPRVYDNWDIFLKKNKLPKCDMCYPTNGVYDVTDGTVNLTFGKSPACDTRTQIFNMLDVSSTVLLVGATGVTLTSLVVPFALPIVYGATATVLASGSYETARTVYRLHDINKHGESLGLKNPDARSAWLGLAGSVVGMASIGATAVAKGVLATESAVSRAGILTLRAINVSSLAVSGIGVLNGIVTLVIKRINGSLENKDILQFTYVCLFFLNAVVTFNVASRLIEELACSDMKNLFNLRENSPFQFTKDIMKYNNLNSVGLLKDLITGAKSIFWPDISIDDLQSIVLQAYVYIQKFGSGEINWLKFSIEMGSTLLAIWVKYERVIMKAIEELKISFDVPCWQILVPKQTSNLEIPRLMCEEVERVVETCGITNSSNERGNVMTLARAFSSVNKSHGEDFINRFKFYCDSIIAQYREEKENYENLLDCKSSEADFNKDAFDKSFGIEGKKEDLFLSKALDTINHPDFLGSIDEFYGNLPRTQEQLNTHLPYLETTKSKIYTFCGPLKKSELENDFYWKTAADLTGFKVNEKNSSMHRQNSFVFIQPKADQQDSEVAEIEAILINSSFKEQSHMGLILLILK